MSLKRIFPLFKIILQVQIKKYRNQIYLIQNEN